jgi:hypothetical protein
MEGGLYLICDGGYPKCDTLICPEVSTSAEDVLLFNEWLEKVRKDVERANGIVKGRFKMFQKGCPFPGFELLDDAWFFCLALHNILLENNSEVDDFTHEYDMDHSELAPRMTASSAQPLPQVHSKTTAFKRKLIDHFTYKVKNDEVKWITKSAKSNTRE